MWFLLLILAAFCVLFAILVFIAHRIVLQSDAWVGRIHRRDHEIAVFIVVVICCELMAWLNIELFDWFPDIRPWYYAASASWATAYTLSNWGIWRCISSTRHMPLSLFRCAVAFVVASLIAKVCGLWGETLVIQDRIRSGITNHESLYTWGDGGNTMTWSEGLFSAQWKSSIEWLKFMKVTAVMSLFALPFLLVLEWLRTGFHPLGRNKR